MQQQKKQSGFTLIELMIVLTVIGIIGAIAYPNYMEHIRKTRRADAKITLQELAQLQESFFTRNFSYAHNLSSLLGGSANTIDSNDGFYQVNISGTAGVNVSDVCFGTSIIPCTSYTLQAVPKSGTSQVNDRQCVRFTLDNMGRRAAQGSSNSTNSNALCW